MTKKKKLIHIPEFVGFCVAMAAARILPPHSLRAVCRLIGSLYYKISYRREIALTNIRNALGDQLGEAEVRRIALASFHSLLFTAAEMMSSPFRLKGGRVRNTRYRTDHVEELFRKAKKIHDESGGCIFVTPHLGNWELLPYVSALIGIPLAIVMRPLNNPYLDRVIFSGRLASGQMLVPKRKAMFTLVRILRRGRSIGMLPDQSTGRGLRMKFFGRLATVTPIPAIMAVTYRRPVVVVAACRTQDPYYFEGFVSDPIYPVSDASAPRGEQADIVSITRQINERMEEIIRKYPEQYLWMHNRWKGSNLKQVFEGIGNSRC
jgi:KDO2-lipid IV(A) lauroyltransferase